MARNQDASTGRKATATGVVTSVQMKEMERRADEAGLTYYQMMENAGTGAAEYIFSRHPVKGVRVLIFCGKGNNGGDGFVAARKLAEQGASVELYLAEGEPRTEDAIRNRQICECMGIPVIDLKEGKEIKLSLEGTDLIIDAIYGTGFHGELRDQIRRITRLINRSKAVVYSLDIPSGLNGDTGAADADTVRADGTIVFHLLKPAHVNDKCRKYCGTIACISIGIEEVL